MFLILRGSLNPFIGQYLPSSKTTEHKNTIGKIPTQTCVKILQKNQNSPATHHVYSMIIFISTHVPSKGRGQEMVMGIPPRNPSVMGVKN